MLEIQLKLKYNINTGITDNNMKSSYHIIILHFSLKNVNKKEEKFMENKYFFKAKDVAEILGISVPAAYKVIRKLNDELKEKGYIIISGQVNRRYFEEKCLYGSKMA
jgi:prophage antirepressor-like protein